jgi:hypothetical protein
MPAQRAAPINFTPQASPTDEVHYFSLVGSSAIHRRSAAYWEALGVGPRPKTSRCSSKIFVWYARYQNRSLSSHVRWTREV